jgi:hypothetical protein
MEDEVARKYRCINLEGEENVEIQNEMEELTWMKQASASTYEVGGGGDLGLDSSDSG